MFRLASSLPMITVLVFGQTGQVATALSQQYQRLPVSRWHFVGRGQADLTDPTSIRAAFATYKPDIVINAAAYTAVDAAENDAETAFAVNHKAVETMAEMCAKLNIPLLHISTDYVFDGTLDRPYTEEDATAPLGVYGASKLAGEEAIRALCPAHVILRTAWVYSPWGKNFVRTMLHHGSTKPELKVVDDQIGNPTAAWDIAESLITIAGELRRGRDDAYGTYHYAGLGGTSWHGFAVEIFKQAGVYGHSVPTVLAIPSADYPTPVTRPANSRLNCHRIAAAFGVPARPWQESLAQSLGMLLMEAGTTETRKTSL